MTQKTDAQTPYEISPGFVWWSTNQSLERQQFSILAIGEVIAAVSVYWLVAEHFETHRHLWVAVAAAPLLLLRSQQSMDQAVQWYDHYNFWRVDSKARASRRRVLVAVCILAAILMCAVYWEFRLFIVGHDYLGGFVWAFAACAANSVFVATLQGAAAPLVPQGAEIEHLDTHRSQRSKFSMTGVLIAIAAVLVGSLATFSIGAMLGSLVYFLFCLVQFPRPLHWTRGVFLAPVFTAGIAAGMWLRSVAFRILATLRFPGPGIRSVPKNFRESLFVVDVRRPVQLLPHPQPRVSAVDY
jgi:hypothetical protein